MFSDLLSKCVAPKDEVNTSTGVCNCYCVVFIHMLNQHVEQKFCVILRACTCFGVTASSDIIFCVTTIIPRASEVSSVKWLGLCSRKCAVQNNFVLLTLFCSANEGPSQLLVSHSQQVREVFAVP